MARLLKKNTKGLNSKFITRAKAIKRLGLSIKDFRKLCILKGVHPREPTKKIGKTSTVYYHTKDIKYL
jgi:pescadillo protein